MKTYCPNCHKETFGLHSCDKDIVGTAADNVYAKQIWNEAIEAAAKVAEINSAANIRKLKKPSTSNISKSLDDAISDELANPPKSLLKE